MYIYDCTLKNSMVCLKKLFQYNMKNDTMNIRKPTLNGNICVVILHYSDFSRLLHRAY